MAATTVLNFVRAFREAYAQGDSDGQKRVISRWLTCMRSGEMVAAVQQEVLMRHGLFAEMLRMVLLPTLQLGDHSLATLLGTGM